MIKNVEVERFTIASLLKYPKLYSDISHFISSEDYAASRLHKMSFQVIADLTKKQEEVNVYVVSQKLKNSGATFSEVEDIHSYLEEILNIQINEKSALEFFKTLARTTAMREIETAGAKLMAEMKTLQKKDASIETILGDADRIYGATMQAFKSQVGQQFINLYENIEALSHARANEPKTNQGFMSPFPRMNEIFGEMLRPGHISLIAARTGVGKTTLGQYVMNYVACHNKVPILHLDCGELSEWEIRERAQVQFSKGVLPLKMVESGDWKHNPEMEKAMTAAMRKMQNYHYYYYETSDLGLEELLSLIRRFKMIHSKDISGVNQFVVNYDYLKSPDPEPYKKEYELLGTMLKKLKNLFKNEIHCPLHTALQENKLGVVGNKTSSQVNDSDESFGLSDRINQQVSLSFKLREMTLDETAMFPNLGNLMLINTKRRFGGMDIQSAQQPVKMNDGSIRKNRLLFESNNFIFTEKGDLKTIAPTLGNLNQPAPDANDHDNTNI